MTEKIINVNSIENLKKQSLKTTLIKDFLLNKELYLMFLPVLLYFVIFKYMPMYGALIAFKNFSPRLGVLGSPFVGLKHFIDFFTSPSFGTVLYNTLRISLSTIAFCFPAPIILALMINELKIKRFSKVMQNITYLPHFISLVVICGIIKDFTMDTGVINTMLEWFGMPRTTLLNHPKYFVPVYVGSQMWQTIGWDSIIYIAALSGVDTELYEAAIVDGANRWKQTLHVTLPGIVPTIIIMLLLKVGGILGVGFEKIILLYNNATMEVADVISTYTYRKGLIDLNWSFSTAVGLFNSAVNFLFLFVTNQISKKSNGIGLW